MIGDRIKLLREGQKQSQEELANTIEMHSNTVARWERGELTPRGTSLARLAQALNTTTAYLLGETDNPKRYTSRLLELVGTDGNESSLVTSEHSTLGDSEAVARLIYERPDGERLELPATPEGYALFEKLVVAMMTDSLKKEFSDSPHSGGAEQYA